MVTTLLYWLIQSRYNDSMSEKEDRKPFGWAIGGILMGVGVGLASDHGTIFFSKADTILVGAAVGLLLGLFIDRMYSRSQQPR